MNQRQFPLACATGSCRYFPPLHMAERTMPTALTHVTGLPPRRSRHALFLAALTLLAGCHAAAPPRYHSTWRRITSRCYQPIHPYCHGYTPTQWSRWPDECQPQEFVIAEEVPLPLPPPPELTPAPAAAPDHADEFSPPPDAAPTPPELFDAPPMPDPPPALEETSPDPPPAPEETSPDRLIVPQGYTPDAIPAPTAVKPPPPKKSITWTAHLQRYLGEVMTFR